MNRLMEFRETYIGELKAVGFSAADAEDVADWYLCDPPGTPFPAHCCRVALGADGYDPNQQRNANGEWTAGGGARAREPETKPQHDRYGINDVSRLASEPDKNAKRAQTALGDVLRKRSGYVDNAAYRPETGWIRLDWGDPGNPHDNFKGGHGISHILAKHPEAAKALPDILARGEIYKHEQPGKLYVLHGTNYAVLGSLHGGAKKTITEFNSAHDLKKIEFIKKQPRAGMPRA